MHLAIRILATGMAVSAVGFGLFTVVNGIVTPSQEPHAFHNVVVGSLLLILSAPPVIAVARSPEAAIQPLLILAVVGVAGLVTMALSVTVDPFTVPFIVLVGVLWILLPSRAGAWPAGRPSPLLVVLVLVAAVPLMVYALGEAELQRTDHVSEHAAFFHWVETSFYVVAVLLLAALAALRPGAFRMAAWCGGGGLAIFGIGSILLSGRASTVESPWAWAALVGSLLFIGIAEWEARRTENETVD
jgi:hypothetical protein